MASTDPPNAVPTARLIPPAAPPPPAPEPHPSVRRLPPAPWVTYGLIATCFGAFVGVCLFAGSTSPDPLTLVCCGAKDRQQIVGAGEWWRLVSAGFLHGSVIHLAACLYALYALGPLVEQFWGRARFLVIYVAAVIGGNLFSLAATPQVSVGSSGGIFGLFGAVAVFATVHRRFIRPGARGRLWVNLVVVAAVNVALGVALPIIDNAAHAGGAALGVLFALVLRPEPARTAHAPLGDFAARLLAAAALFATVVSLVHAAAYARDSGWILMARTDMETRTLEDGRLTIAVPRGWRYTAPRQQGAPHRFDGRRVAQVHLFVRPPREAADVAPLVRAVIAQETKDGGTLAARRATIVRERLGVELLFRRGGSLRLRHVIFPDASDRILHAVLGSRTRVIGPLDLLFDQMVQSIRTIPTPPNDTAAEDFWHRFIDDRSDVEACTMLATFYSLEGRPGDAVQMLRLAIATRSGYAPAHDQLAYLYATARKPFRRPTRAIRHARTAIRLQPDSARYHATLAVAHEAAGDLPNALAAARKAAALDPKDATFADLVSRLAARAARGTR